MQVESERCNLGIREEQWLHPSLCKIILDRDVVAEVPIVD